MTEREKDNLIMQLQDEVGKWHHAYDALMTERTQLVSQISELEGALRNIFIRTR